MNATQVFLDSDTAHEQIQRARVVQVGEHGIVYVRSDASGAPISCDVLMTSDAQLRLDAGDSVLVWKSEPEAAWGVVLGRVGPSQASVGASQDTPDELVISAKESLTLRCGDGSITLRRDGKILIKGKELVSHARRTNRIKGGSVAIN